MHVPAGMVSTAPGKNQSELSRKSTLLLTLLLRRLLILAITSRRAANGLPFASWTLVRDMFFLDHGHDLPGLSFMSRFDILSEAFWAVGAVGRPSAGLAWDRVEGAIGGQGKKSREGKSVVRLK